MSAHAKLSPSSAHRWIQCPGSVRLSAQVEETSSVYADEGTMAHKIAEIEASIAFGLISKRQYARKKLAWAKATPDEYHEDMLEHAASYVKLLRELEAEHPHTQVMLEQRVDTGVPASWGTLDAALVSPLHLYIVDYKYGMGIPVDAWENPQLKMYGLGGYDMFNDLLTDIEYVTLVVCQPRLDSVSMHTLTTKELLGWREAVAKPAAALALSPDAYLAPSDEACRFCPVAGSCRARVEYMTRRDFGNPELLAPEEIGAILVDLPDIRNWCKAVEENALNLAYHDRVPIPGWKVVKSGGKREFVDKEKAFSIFSEAGYEETQFSRKSLETLAKLEKLVGGKAPLTELMGENLARTEGREALVPESDPRPEVSALTDAQKDFEGE